MNKYTHDNELWRQSEGLLEQIKQDYGLFSMAMDDTALIDIRGAMIDYANYCMDKAEKDRKAKRK